MGYTFLPRSQLDSNKIVTAKKGITSQLWHNSCARYPEPIFTTPLKDLVDKHDGKKQGRCLQ